MPSFIRKLQPPNLSLKQDIKVLNVQIREQKEAILKIKIDILKITEEKEKIQQQFDANSNTAQKDSIFALQSKNLDLVAELEEFKSVIKELKEVNLVLSKKQEKKIQDQTNFKCKLCNITFESASLF